jgi:hypothetical protein
VLDVARALVPIATAVAGLFPHPNPIGMPVPWDLDTDPEALAIPATPRD